MRIILQINHTSQSLLTNSSSQRSHIYVYNLLQTYLKQQGKSVQYSRYFIYSVVLFLGNLKEECINIHIFKLKEDFVMLR